MREYYRRHPMPDKSKVAWSTDPCHWIKQEVEKLGSVELFLRRTFRPPCSYTDARKWSTTMGRCLDVSADEFMASWKRLKGTDGQRLNAALKEAEASRHTSSDSGSNSDHGIKSSD